MRRQKQPEYFSLRLKCIGGRLTAEQLGVIREVAEKFGGGYVHLTTRQGMEIPFVHSENVEAVKKILAAGGVMLKTGNLQILACKGGEICRSGLIDTARLAEKFDARYGERELPRKFSIGLAGCPNNCLRGENLNINGGIKPSWNAENCNFCGACQKVCPQKIIVVDKNKKTVAQDGEKCIYCGKCVKSCPVGAWHGKCGFVISFGGIKNCLPIIFDEEKLFKIVDAALNFFSENAKTGWEKFLLDSQNKIV